MLLFYTLCLLWLAVETVGWPTHIKTYSIHQSCYTKYRDFDSIVEEVFEKARRASTRTENALWAGDADWARVFKFFMKTDLDDQTKYLLNEDAESNRFWPGRGTEHKTAREHVIDTLNDLATGWTVIPWGTGADVRINCQNMRNWVRVFPQQGRQGDEGYWRDEENLLLLRTWEHCNLYPGARLQAMVSNKKSRNPSNDRPDDPNPIRSEISFCDFAFDNNIQGIKWMRRSDNLATKGNSLIKQHQSLSRILMHEWLHTYRYDFVDNFEAMRAIGATAGLAYANAITDAVVAIQSPENYAYLGTFALLADRRPVFGVGEAPSKTGGYSIRRDIATLALDSREMKRGDILRGYLDVVDVEYGEY